MVVVFLVNDDIGKALRLYGSIISLIVVISIATILILMMVSN